MTKRVMRIRFEIDFEPTDLQSAAMKREIHDEGGVVGDPDKKMQFSGDETVALTVLAWDGVPAGIMGELPDAKVSMLTVDIEP